jgi:hypothetical protein
LASEGLRIGNRVRIDVTQQVLPPRQEKETVVKPLHHISHVIGVAMLLSLASAPCIAQTRAALVKNVDEAGRMPYQQMLNFNTLPPDCPLTKFCVVSFAAVPAGKRLVVQANFWALGDSTTINVGNVAILQPDFSPSTSFLDGRFWAADRKVRVYYEAGQTPKLKISASGVFSLVGNASLHGYLIDATN